VNPPNLGVLPAVRTTQRRRKSIPAEIPDQREPSGTSTKRQNNGTLRSDDDYQSKAHPKAKEWGGTPLSRPLPGVIENRCKVEPVLKKSRYLRVLSFLVRRAHSWASFRKKIRIGLSGIRGGLAFSYKQYGRKNQKKRS